MPNRNILYAELSFGLTSDVDIISFGKRSQRKPVGFDERTHENDWMGSPPVRLLFLSPNSLLGRDVAMKYGVPSPFVNSLFASTREGTLGVRLHRESSPARVALRMGLSCEGFQVAGGREYHLYHSNLKHPVDS
jgi:hypothetical protein